jgi:hypothetical protein
MDMNSSIFWDVTDKLYCTPVGSFCSVSEPVGSGKLSRRSLMCDI